MQAKGKRAKNHNGENILFSSFNECHNEKQGV